MAQNIRRSLTESYDPKQRIVGGIVLFLLMLLLYLILKIILGISSSLHNNNYIPQERMFEENGKYVEEPNEKVVGSPAVENSSSVSTPRKPGRPLPGGFVFLDINGNPMQKEIYQATEETARKVDATTIEGTHWVVQAGSFTDEGRAQRLVQELKEGGIDSEIVKISKWFTVRLVPQRDRQAAEQQLRQLHQKIKGTRGLIKKIE